MGQLENMAPLSHIHAFLFIHVILIRLILNSPQHCLMSCPSLPMFSPSKRLVNSLHRISMILLRLSNLVVLLFQPPVLLLSHLP